MLQQYLPFTVLKPTKKDADNLYLKKVATVLTVYGIETMSLYWLNDVHIFQVATVLTVYGIETRAHVKTKPVYSTGCNSTYRLRY